MVDPSFLLRKVGNENWNEPLWSPKEGNQKLDGFLEVISFLIPCLSHQQVLMVILNSQQRWFQKHRDMGNKGGHIDPTNVLMVGGN